MLEQTEGLHLPAKFYLNVFVVSVSDGQKPQFCANFDIFGLLYRPPFTDEGYIWCAIASIRAKFRLDLIIVSPLAAKKTILPYLVFGI